MDKEQTQALGVIGAIGESIVFLESQADLLDQIAADCRLKAARLRLTPLMEGFPLHRDLTIHLPANVPAEGGDKQPTGKEEG